MSAQTQLRAGTAKVDITTSEEGVRINDPLYAKVLVLDDGRTRVAIIAMDAVAIGGIGDVKDDFLPRLRQGIGARLPIPADHVLVNASHTHPPGRLLCSDEEQLKRVQAAVVEAYEGLTPVQVGVGVGHEDRIMMNRTLRLRDGRHWSIRHANPCPPDEEVASLGPVDPQIGILRLDRLDGTPLAVVYNFACHPFLGVPKGGVTADYPGFASQVIEETLGHGALALFLQGAGGDIMQMLYKDVHRPRDCEPQGVMLGLRVLAAWRQIQPGRRADLQVIMDRIELPRRTDVETRVQALRQEQQRLLQSLRYTFLNFKSFLPLYLKHRQSLEHPLDDVHRYLHEAEELAAIDAQNEKNLAKYMSNIRAMELLARLEDQIGTLRRHEAINDKAGEPTITAEVQGIRVGESVWITAPFEALVEIGLGLKERSPHQYTFMAAFSNGYMHYGPPAAYYDLGSYEVTECLLAPQWQELYERAALGILHRL